MSHTILIEINDKEVYHELCDNLLEKVSEIQKVTKENRSEYSRLIDSINEIRNNLSKSFDEVGYMEFLRHISSTEKRVANIYVNTKNKMIESLCSILKENEINIINEYEQHGSLVNEVIGYLKANNLKINKKNFDEFLPIVENIELTKEKITAYLKESFQFIDQSKLPSEIKYELKKEIRDIKTINNIKDINPIIQTKENDYLKVMQLSKTVSKMLGKQNFKYNGTKKWEYNKTTGEIIFKFNFENDKNNTVQMIINSNGQLKYKLGNYIGHACEKTTEKLIEDLKKQNIQVKILNITRDFEYNQASMQKEIKREK